MDFSGSKDSDGRNASFSAFPLAIASVNEGAMRIVTDNPFTNISVFGSSARGEQDSFSDFDVIAIVKDGKGKQEDSIVRKAVLAYSDKPPSISWYGENKVRNFFELGDLFAWHLYLGSGPIDLN